MDSAKFRPRHWDHTARAIEFHRTTAKGCHGMNQRKVLGLKVMDVTEYLSFRMMFIEDRMREIFRGSPEGFRDG